MFVCLFENKKEIVCEGDISISEGTIQENITTRDKMCDIITGSLMIKRCSSMDFCFPKLIRNVKRIDGDFKVLHTIIINEIPLNELTKVEKMVSIYMNKNMMSLDGLRNLKYVGGDFIFGGSYPGNVKNNVIIMNNLEYVGGSIFVYGKNLIDIQFLKIKSIESLIIDSFKYEKPMKVLDGFMSLVYVKNEYIYRRY